MKKIGLMMMMAAFGCPAAFAGSVHKKNDDQVSYMAKQDFKADFPNINNVRWSRDEQYSEGSFVKNNMPMHAFFDWNGDLTGITHQVAYSELPESARKRIAKDYRDYSVENVILYKDNEDNLNDLYPLVPYEGPVNYFVSLKRDDLPEHSIILQVTPRGNVSFFQNLR